MKAALDAINFYSGPSFNFKLGGLYFAPTYIQAATIVFLLFILVLTLAQVRRHFMSWSIKGGLFGLFFGFLLALILEGFLLIGGRTAITELLGWKNPPKPVSVALDAGKDKLINVLGENTQIDLSKAESPVNSEAVIKIFESLNVDQANKVRQEICKP